VLLISINDALNRNDPRRVRLPRFEFDPDLPADRRSFFLQFGDKSFDLRDIQFGLLESEEDAFEEREEDLPK